VPVKGQKLLEIIERAKWHNCLTQEGIRPGQQLLSISDPIRNDEAWEISIETKLSRVRDALQFRSPPTISLQLTSSSIEDEAGFEWRYSY
jgi:hypothetical protein